MIECTFTVPEIAFFAGTRAFLGIGIGLLISGRLTKDRRKAAGLALTLLGALAVFPPAPRIIGRKSESEEQIRQAA
jgi:hypothetical protein